MRRIGQLRRLRRDEETRKAISQMMYRMLSLWPRGLRLGSDVCAVVGETTGVWVWLSKIEIHMVKMNTAFVQVVESRLPNRYSKHDGSLTVLTGNRLCG